MDWFIIVSGVQEGPLTLQQLREHPELKAKSWVWREGLEQWVLAEEVDELKDLFKARKPAPKPVAPPPKGTEDIPADEVVLVAEGNGPNPFIWLVLLMILIFFLVVRLWW